MDYETLQIWISSYSRAGPWLVVLFTSRMPSVVLHLVLNIVQPGLSFTSAFMSREAVYKLCKAALVLALAKCTLLLLWCFEHLHGSWSYHKSWKGSYSGLRWHKLTPSPGQPESWLVMRTMGHEHPRCVLAWSFLLSFAFIAPGQHGFSSSSSSHHHMTPLTEQNQHEASINGIFNIISHKVA